MGSFKSDQGGGFTIASGPGIDLAGRDGLVTISTSALIAPVVEASDFTFDLTQAGQLVQIGNATATVPADTTVNFPISTQIDLQATNATPFVVAAAIGVTINSKLSKLSVGAQWSGATLIKTAANTWWLVGDLA